MQDLRDNHDAAEAKKGKTHHARELKLTTVFLAVLLKSERSFWRGKRYWPGVRPDDA
jgi:hypothetical protein